MEFKELKPRFKSAKTRFKLSAGLNLETFDTILSGTNHIKAAVCYHCKLTLSVELKKLPMFDFCKGLTILNF